MKKADSDPAKTVFDDVYNQIGSKWAVGASQRPSNAF